MACRAVRDLPISHRQQELAFRLRRRVEIERARLAVPDSRSDPLLLRVAELTTPLLERALDLANWYRFGLRNAMRPVVRHIPLAFPALPPAFHGFRILHLSDLHIDGIDGLDEIVAEIAARLSVDLCVLTGDYRFRTSGSCAAVYDRLRTIVESIESVHGTIGILGNHDAAEMVFVMEDMGVRMLVNDSVELRRRDDSIWIIGVDDPYIYACDDLPLALEHVPLETFKVLLAHTPQLTDRAATIPVNLYLCGHAHGGQIKLPGLGPLIRGSRCYRRYGHGLWRHGTMRGYTSAGIGCSFLPVRFNCPPEIVVIELNKSDSDGRRC